MFPIDAFHLARAQFAFTLIFHIVFPAFSIGLASYLAVLEGLWLRSGNSVYLDLFRYWLKIFSIGFAMGVVSGLVMSYQFGTNWGAFSDRAGPVIGPLMGYEVLTAFFLEAGFLGVMLFGMQKVGPRLHFAATCLVALGTLISAFWILSVNSWMQTPRGYTIAPDGRFLPADWLAVIFNPSFFVRLPHMVLASYLSVAFVVGAVGAYHMLRERAVFGEARNVAAKKMFSMAMWMAAIVAPAQIVMGDLHGLNTLKYQPAKIAAMEGDWEPTRDAPEILFGIPDMAAQVTRYKIELPHLGSLILTHSLDGVVPGLKQFARAERPDSRIVFFSFRGMIAIGFLMAGIGMWSLFLRWRRSLLHNPWILRAMVPMGPAGFVAVILGWITTEVGRQPYTVYGLMRTADSLSPIGLPGVATSLIGFIVVYAIVYAAGIGFLLRLMSRPPVPGEPDMPTGQPIRTAGLTPGPAGAAPEAGWHDLPHGPELGQAPAA
jgi:cytochrome d ubiquinol oxidase subunit I